MPTPKTAIKDDYYANVSTKPDADTASTQSTQKPLLKLKIKPKTVSPDTLDTPSAPVHTADTVPTVVDTPRAKIIRKATVPTVDTTSTSSVPTPKKPTDTASVSPTPSAARSYRDSATKKSLPARVDVPRPRTDENTTYTPRENTSKSLMDSAFGGMRRASAPVDTARKNISFGSGPSGLRVLENRPVVQLSPEESRRGGRRDGKSTYTGPVRTAGGTSTPGAARTPDGNKPMFQRNLGYTNASRDGTAKKWKKKEYLTADEAAKKSKKLRSVGVEDDGTFRRGHKSAWKKKEKNIEDIKQVLVDRTGQEVYIPDSISVKEFSDKTGISLAKILSEMIKNGMLVSLNTQIDYDTCYLIGETFGIKIFKEASEEVSVSDLMTGNISDLIAESDTSLLSPRAPIISIMGHVDHGKTSILDYIRKTKVAAGEAGGITQKIGAYQVEKDGRKITFLDTPGHEAFTIMRARGAKLTDIAIIVVAADEGMKPQTIESINHAKDAGVPIIVVANKMDKPGANLDLIRGQMAEHGLQPEDWGGTVVLVPVSAHTGLGMETLLDMILLSADMLDLRANPARAGVATVIEAHLDQKLGSVATILVNTGTLKKWDIIVCASAYGRVRTLKDFRGKNIDEAGPGVPVQITGLGDVVSGGDILQAVSTIEIAQVRAHDYDIAKGRKSINSFEGASLWLLMSRLKSGALKNLKIVLKCDTGGSLEALKASLAKLSTPETQVSFIHAGVGEVNQSDVTLAGTSQALLIAYNVGIISTAKSMLAQSKIEFIDKKVIYHVLEKVESIITGMIDIRYEELELGASTVKAIFYTGKWNGMMIVGMEVDSGKVENKSKIRIIRGERKVGSGEVANLKMWPLDVNEAEAGEECGINYKGDTLILEGDRLEFYKMVQRK